MTLIDLRALHACATDARDAAHRAYVIALRNRSEAGDTADAYDALLSANRVRDRVYAAIVASTP